MPRARKKGRGAMKVPVERQASQDSNVEGAPRVKETRLETPSPARGGINQRRSTREKITDFFSSLPQLGSEEKPAVGPESEAVESVEAVTTPVSEAVSPHKLDHNYVSEELDDCSSARTPQVPHTAQTNLQSDALNLEQGLELSLPEDDATDGASDRSKADSGKENELEDVWRGSRSSLASRSSRNSRPRSGHLADLAPSANKAPSEESRGRVTRSNTAHHRQPGLSLSVDNLVPNDLGAAPQSPVKCGGGAQPQSPPTPHKIQIPDRKTSSTATSAFKKLKEISLTPKNNTSTKSTKAKRLVSGSSESSNNNKPVSGSTKEAKLAAAAETSHKVTEYFPIRRSERKPKNELLKEEMEGIEARLLAESDSDLSLEVVELPDKGRGVQAGCEFKKGDFIVEYAGDLIDVGSAKEREVKYSLDVTKGCYMYYFKHKAKQYCIDATSESGRLGRLLNHSRQNPNCVTKVVMLGDVPRLILVARQDIAKGEELLYDYGDRSKESLKAHPWLAL